MTIDEFSRVAHALRPKLVQLTVVRGHERDDADDIVQEGIITGLSHAAKCRNRSDVEKLLRTITFRLSHDWHKVSKCRSAFVTRLDARDDDGEVQGALLHDDGAEQRDLKLDVQRALGQLSEDDRELARLLFIEGWTQEEALALHSDRFSSRFVLRQHVTDHILPLLRTALAAYRGTF